jgi:hypothetical protein
MSGTVAGTNITSGGNTTGTAAGNLPLAGGSMTGQITTRTTTGATPIVSGGGSDSLQIMGNGPNGAWFSFHRAGAYAVNLGLDTSNVVSLGGWSDGGTSRWTSDTSGNFAARGTISAPRGTFTPNTNGVSTGVTVVNGDLTAYRSGGTTGVVYLSSAGSHYLYWDGTNYNLNAGNLICTGNVTAYSDERLKKDWADLPGDFLSQLAKIKHGTYTRIDSDDRQAGVSAQQMQAFLPEVVQTDEKGNLTLAYGNAALVAAVKLAERVVALEARLAALEAKG